MQVLWARRTTALDKICENATTFLNKPTKQAQLIFKLEVGILCHFCILPLPSHCPLCFAPGSYSHLHMPTLTEESWGIFQPFSLATQLGIFMDKNITIWIHRPERFLVTTERSGRGMQPGCTGKGNNLQDMQYRHSFILLFWSDTWDGDPSLVFGRDSSLKNWDLNVVSLRKITKSQA